MKTKPFIIIIVILFIAGVIGSVLVLTAPPKTAVRVISDGRIVYTADLGVTEDTVFDVKYEGHVNTVEIKDHRIRVSSADCPDQTCVHMGWLQSSAMPIVCLPHKLVIEYVDSTGAPDAVTE